MTQTVVYDKIGKTYDTTRKADPEILDRIYRHLSPKNGGKYLDLGCGSGNYTNALFQKGVNICGLDISQEMLSKAKLKNPKIDWIQGDAKALPFHHNSFDGATCILATHHIKDIETAFKEAFRVIKKGSFVIFTAFPEQMQAYWLIKYFPKIIQEACAKNATFAMMSKALKNAGFKNIKQDNYFVTNQLQDWFLHAGKYRPEIYLDPMVRSGISSFPLAEDQEEIAIGCKKLEQDIRSGKIHEIIKSYESHLGDYAFVVCEHS